jgi:hypothetical protein
MDLTPLRPTISFLSSKARKQERISRSVTRLSTWIVACTLAATERALGWTALLRFPLIHLFALLTYSPYRLLVVLLHATLPENPDKATGCHSARNWSGRPSATCPRSSQGPSSEMVHADFALWPAFCSGSCQWKSKPVRGARLEIGFCKGGLWVIPSIQSVY